MKFKTITKKVLGCYEGLNEKYKVHKNLIWMRPEACLKHENHPSLQKMTKTLTPYGRFSMGFVQRVKAVKAHGMFPE